MTVSESNAIPSCDYGAWNSGITYFPLLSRNILFHILSQFLNWALFWWNDVLCVLRSPLPAIQYAWMAGWMMISVKWLIRGSSFFRQIFHNFLFCDTLRIVYSRHNSYCVFLTPLTSLMWMQKSIIRVTLFWRYCYVS